MDGKLMERDNGCTLMMVVKEWRSGMGIGICESRHGRTNEGTGMVEGAATWAGCERWARMYIFLTVLYIFPLTKYFC